jgi:hypothetical protein
MKQSKGGMKHGYGKSMKKGRGKRGFVDTPASFTSKKDLKK